VEGGDPANKEDATAEDDAVGAEYLVATDGLLLLSGVDCCCCCCCCCDCIGGGCSPL